MNSVAAQAAPRLRVLGDRAAYVKYGLDVQEEALHQGMRPGQPGWGEDPEERWGLLGAGDRLERIRTEPGSYQRFYEGVASALLQGGPAPVDPEDAVSALEVLDAARRSAGEGKVVEV
jgi:predicted dehydrogenase